MMPLAMFNYNDVIDALHATKHEWMTFGMINVSDDYVPHPWATMPYAKFTVNGNTGQGYDIDIRPGDYVVATDAHREIMIQEYFVIQPDSTWKCLRKFSYFAMHRERVFNLKNKDMINHIRDNTTAMRAVVVYLATHLSLPAILQNTMAENYAFLLLALHD